MIVRLCPADKPAYENGLSVKQNILCVCAEFAKSEFSAENFMFAVGICNFGDILVQFGRRKRPELRFFYKAITSKRYRRCYRVFLNYAKIAVFFYGEFHFGKFFFGFYLDFYAPVYPGAYFYYGFIFHYFIRLSNRRPA